MPQEEKKHIKTSTGILIILAAAVIIGGGAIAYFYAMSPTSWDYMGQKTAVHKSSNANTNTSNTNSGTKGTATDWKTYTNSTYGFNLKYPKDWILKEENTNDNILIVQSDESLNPEDAVVLKYYSSISGLNHAWDGSNNAKTIDEFINNVGFKKLGNVNISSIESPKFLESALGGNNYDILTIQNGHVFMFQLIGKEQLTNIDTQILSTFQFTQ